jgi:hypothetical protein
MTGREPKGSNELKNMRNELVMAEFLATLRHLSTGQRFEERTLGIQLKRVAASANLGEEVIAYLNIVYKAQDRWFESR